MIKIGVVAIILLITAFLVLSGLFIYKVGNINSAGKIVDEEPDKVNKEESGIENSTEFLKFEFQCKTENPFFCKIWSFNRERNEIKVQLWNNGVDDLIIQSFQVSNCDNLKKEDFFLQRGGARAYDFHCVLGKEGTFRKSFEIRYKSEKGGPQQNSSGIIDEKQVN